METRDKLFTEEQYLKQLAEYADDIKEEEEEIIASYDKEHNSGGMSPYVFLLKYRIGSLVTMYFYGKGFRMLKNRLSSSSQSNARILDTIRLLPTNVMVTFDRYHVRL